MPEVTQPVRAAGLEPLFSSILRAAPAGGGARSTPLDPRVIPHSGEVRTFLVLPGVFVGVGSGEGLPHLNASRSPGMRHTDSPPG